MYFLVLMSDNDIFTITKTNLDNSFLIEKQQYPLCFSKETDDQLRLDRRSVEPKARTGGDKERDVCIGGIEARMLMLWEAVQSKWMANLFQHFG